MDEVEDRIEVDDLPNFRFEATPAFDVESAAPPSAHDPDSELARYDLPDVIRSFVVYFQTNLRDRNVYEVHSIYENSFNKLTERYYKSSPWPPAEAIAPLVNNDQQFLLLYKELYYRHIYSKLQPTLEQRIESWANYCDIFNLLLSADSPVALELPNQWLWDMIDECIYQFQAFCQFRSRVKNKSDEELRVLKESPHVWSVHKVLYYLHALVDKSCIRAHLAGEPDESPFVKSSLYKMMGYFSARGHPNRHPPPSSQHTPFRGARSRPCRPDRPAAHALPARGLPACAQDHRRDRPRQEGPVHARHRVPHLHLLLRRLGAPHDAPVTAPGPRPRPPHPLARSPQRRRRRTDGARSPQVRGRHQDLLEHPLLHRPHQAVPHALVPVRPDTQEE